MKLFIKKYFLYLLILFSLTACPHIRVEGPQQDFRKDLANASPDFQHGWEDGCEVGRATGDNSFYRMAVKNNKVDGWKMSNSPDYQIAWNYSFWYCYRDDHVDQKSGPVRAFFAGMQ